MFGFLHKKCFSWKYVNLNSKSYTCGHEHCTTEQLTCLQRMLTGHKNQSVSLGGSLQGTITKKMFLKAVFKNGTIIRWNSEQKGQSQADMTSWHLSAIYWQWFQAALNMKLTKLKTNWIFCLWYIRHDSHWQKMQTVPTVVYDSIHINNNQDKMQSIKHKNMTYQGVLEFFIY